jgi:endonuclease G
MKKLFDLLPVLALIIVISVTAYADNSEIHNKHFIYGIPKGTPASNDLIIRDIYALSSNDQRKFADWVCYYLTPHETFGTLDLEREWRNDPWLDKDETLEGKPSKKDDYKCAYNALKYDRGHLAPIGSFKGSRFASQANFYSNITPQKENLNKGPWKRLEEKVRLLVEKYGHAWVMTGPLYENDMPPLPNADETHIVPSGYWKIIVVIDSGNIQVAAFIMEQDVARNSKVIDHLVKVDDVESRSGLDFLWELPDTQEMPIESQLNTAWVNEHFK